MTHPTETSCEEEPVEQPLKKIQKTLPAEPASITETGLSRHLLLQLIAKTLYVANELTETSAAAYLKLPYSIVKELLAILVKEKLCEVKGPSDSRAILFRYALTGMGMTRAQEYMEVSTYVGAAPVPLSQFEAMVRQQSASRLTIKRASLEKALHHLVLKPQVSAQLGGAVNSGAPIFLYGESGNGKTVIGDAIGTLLSGDDGGEILFPYAIEVDEQIVEVFDPAVHTPCEAPEDSGATPGKVGARSKHDRRWVLCKRPIVFTGGELTLPMLDLTFNPISRFYAAPPQVKASGGVFIIDDFGRQNVPPQMLLNRWIVPLEKHVDYLTLHTGKKFCIPFDTLVIFCTNLEPEKLADEAFLRRIRNKIYVGDPTLEEYTEIFRRYCEKTQVSFQPGAVEYLYRQYYGKYGIPPRSCHPRDLVEQILSIAKFYEVAPSLETWFLDRACENYLLLGRKGNGGGDLRGDA